MSFLTPAAGTALGSGLFPSSADAAGMSLGEIKTCCKKYLSWDSAVSSGDTPSVCEGSESCDMHASHDDQGLAAWSPGASERHISSGISSSSPSGCAHRRCWELVGPMLMQMLVGCLGPEQCSQESHCLSLEMMLPLVAKGWLFISQSSPLVLAFLRHISDAAHGRSAPKLP